jgi:hypothetical protein
MNAPVQYITGVFLSVGCCTLPCFYFFMSKIASIGDCKDFTAQSREIWAEALAIVLALLLAGRKEPPDNSPPNGETQ